MNLAYTFGPTSCLSIAWTNILPTAFHPHRSRDVLVEDLATPNIP